MRSKFYKLNIEVIFFSTHFVSINMSLKNLIPLLRDRKANQINNKIYLHFLLQNQILRTKY